MGLPYAVLLLPQAMEILGLWLHSTTTVQYSTTTVLRVHVVLHVLQLVIDGEDVRVGQLKALDVGLGGN